MWSHTIVLVNGVWRESVGISQTLPHYLLFLPIAPHMHWIPFLLPSARFHSNNSPHLFSRSLILFLSPRPFCVSTKTWWHFIHLLKESSLTSLTLPATISFPFSPLLKIFQKTCQNSLFPILFYFTKTTTLNHSSDFQVALKLSFLCPYLDWAVVFDSIHASLFFNVFPLLVLWFSFFFI